MIFDEQVDPRAELERLIVDNTCEWCGETKLPELTDSGKSIVYVQRLWLCRELDLPGYKSKHYRYWRVCDVCQQKRLWGHFDKFIFPVIKNMPPMQGLMEQLVAVQPMAQPAPQVLYLDYIVGPEGARRVNLPERHPLLRRYAEVGLDERLYGRGVIDAAKDKEDATVMTMVMVKNREDVKVLGRTKFAVTLDDANFRCDPRAAE